MRYDVPRLEILGDATAIVLGKDEQKQIIDHVGPYVGEPDMRTPEPDPSIPWTTRPDA